MPIQDAAILSAMSQLSGDDVFEITRLILVRAKESDDAIQLALVRIADTNGRQHLEVRATLNETRTALTNVVERLTELEAAKRTRAAAPPWIALAFMAGSFLISLMSLYLATHRPS